MMGLVCVVGDLLEKRTGPELDTGLRDKEIVGARCSMAAVAYTSCALDSRAPSDQDSRK